jgi:small-conductance mechanosensitive channel
MRLNVWRLSLVVFLIVAAASALVYLNITFTSYGYVFKYVYAFLILTGGVVVTRELALVASRNLHGGDKRGLLIGNAITVGGYIASAVTALTYASFSPTALLASATFGGLVLGLALQPTLGSFFAGVLILVSGTIRPGSEVRIMTWHIPFQWASNPGYKYFSPDQVYPGYLAEVREIGLFFTTVLTEEGQTMRLPNTIIATDAAVVTYTDRDYIFNVRYEFPSRFDPSTVLKRVKEIASAYPVINCFINEQSDKQYYIVKVVLNAQQRDHALIKSDILTKLIALSQELEAKTAEAKP